MPPGGKCLQCNIKDFMQDHLCKRMYDLWNIFGSQFHLRHCSIIIIYPVNESAHDSELQMSTWSHLRAASMMYITSTV